MDAAPRQSANRGRGKRHLLQHHRRAYLAILLERSDLQFLENAFYDVRVIQIPSPRWTAYDQKRTALRWLNTCR